MKPDAFRVIQRWLAEKVVKTSQVGQKVQITKASTVKPVVTEVAPEYWEAVSTEKGDTGFREAYLWCRWCKDIVIQYTHTPMLTDRELSYLCQKGHTNKVPATIGELR